MDMDNELARAKWLLFSAALFLVSCCITYGEAVYFVRGRQTDATITKVYEETLRGRFGVSRGQRLTVEYSFAEPDGTRRRDSDTVSLDWDIPSTGKIPVQYTPGAEGPLAAGGAGELVWDWVLCRSVLLLVLFAIGLYREMADSAPRSKKRRAVKNG